MKKSLLYIALAILTISLTNCSDEEKGMTPSDISNIHTEERPGGIFLKWEKPADNSVLYVKVSYQDPLLDKYVTRLSSCDTILLPDTRKKYGEYKITLQPYSSTDTAGKTENISATSGAAPATNIASQLTLKASDLSSNAQEPTEGPIGNLLDGNINTFFHTAHSEDIPAPHWLQVKLPQGITEYYRFHYAPRKNGSDKPTEFDLMGSANGESWFLLKTFTKAGDALPVSSTGTYTSPDLKTSQPFNYIRIVVKSTNTGSVFWTMSEFKFYNVIVIDPEAK